MGCKEDQISDVRQFFETASLHMYETLCSKSSYYYECYLFPLPHYHLMFVCLQAQYLWSSPSTRCTSTIWSSVRLAWKIKDQPVWCRRLSTGKYRPGANRGISGIAVMKIISVNRLVKLVWPQKQIESVLIIQSVGCIAWLVMLFVQVNDIWNGGEWMSRSDC